VPHPEPLARLIEQFQRLPGIGAKGAQRLAFHVLRTPREDADRLCDAIRDVKDRVTYCSICNTITDVDPCVYCTDQARDQAVICVVEEPQNVAAIEKTREFRGTYHVLMGALSPLSGVGPDDLKIKGLLGRVGEGRVQEVVLATNPNVEGERDLPGAAAEAARRPRHPHRHRYPGRQRHRVRGRGHDVESDARTEGSVVPRGHGATGLQCDGAGTAVRGARCCR
jgi:recombination protein RecR